MIIHCSFHYSQMSSSDRALINAFREISNMADKINLPKTIIDRANVLFKQVREGMVWEVLGEECWDRIKHLPHTATLNSDQEKKCP